MEAEAEAELSPDLFSRMRTFLSYQPAAFLGYSSLSSQPSHLFSIQVLWDPFIYIICNPSNLHLRQIMLS